MVNACHPGGVIGLVVLRPERGQPEFPGYEPAGYREVVRNEQLIAHPAIVTRRRRQAALAMSSTGSAGLRYWAAFWPKLDGPIAGR